MSTTAFDTLATVRALEQAGMDAALSALEVRLVKWAVGIALASVALLVAAGGVLLPLLIG